MNKIATTFALCGLGIAACSPEQAQPPLPPDQLEVEHYEVDGDLHHRIGSVTVYHATNDPEGNLVRVDYYFAEGDGGDISSGLDAKKITWCEASGEEHQLYGLGSIEMSKSSEGTEISMGPIFAVSQMVDPESTACADNILVIGE